MPIATKSSKIDISKEIITQKIAEKIASKVSKNTTLLFYGNIGVGKTTFIRHLINYLQTILVNLGVISFIVDNTFRSARRI